MVIEWKFIWEGTFENWDVYCSKPQLIPNLTYILNLQISIFLGSLDYQISMPKGLHLFATISQVATLIINDKKTTKILKFLPSFF